MKVLVTGGSGVVGEGVIPALLKSGHEVRLLAREAARDARRWPARVEPFAADVADAESMRGAADGCAAVLHIAGIVEEHPPDVTFRRVNVAGTRNALDEAERAGVGRFVFVSSLGTERGESDYHRSKREAEAMVARSAIPHVTIRLANVYGPGDRVVSAYLTMFRTLPVIPLIGDGDRQFQPIFYRDAGDALARAIDGAGVEGRVLEVAGEDLTSMNDLADRFERITGRSPLRLPLPELLAAAGVVFAEGFGASAPLSPAMLEMLVEGNVVRTPGANALSGVFGVTPTSLDAGLVELANAVPERLPDEGFGALERKRFRADIVGSGASAAELLARFRRRFRDLMPVETKAEPHAPEALDYAATITMNIPGRGNVQVRVVECDDARVTLATLEGHPLAGVVHFEAEPHGEAVRFEIETYTRPATRLDFVAMHTIGQHFQDANWRKVVEGVVEMSGGEAPAGIEEDAKALDDDEATEVERRIDGLVAAFHRRTVEAEINS